MIFSHKDRNRAYNFIYSKFFAKFGTLKANKLNHAGRLQYINSVLSSIPVYYMYVVFFSKSFIDKINSIIRRFWWAGVQEEHISNQGGLGIRDMELINKNLIIQSAWNVVTDKNPFLSAILKAKYYPTTSFGQALLLGLALFPGHLGHLFYRSSPIYMPMLSYKFMQETHPYGQHLGLDLGQIYMTVLFYL
jgi:hypothetical protein